MRSNDKLVARTIIQNAFEASKGDKDPDALVRFAFSVEKHLYDAGFEIVRKPQPGASADDRIEFARRLGNWDGVTLQDIQKWLAACRAGFMSRDDVIRLMGGDPVEVDCKIAEERARAATFGLSHLSDGAAEAAAPEPERDDLGLRPWSADDLAARYGCRVEIAGMDDAHMPLTDESIAGDPQYVVVTERATGRVVGMVEASQDEDGDVLVPHNWLSTVLSAWDAARDPQQAA
ncbi:MAG: hypothetical protein PGN34_14245 [Methylobacterium frigidaeris]